MRRTCLFSTCPIPTAISIGRGMTKGRISEQPTQRTSQPSGTWPRVSPIRKKEPAVKSRPLSIDHMTVKPIRSQRRKMRSIFFPFSRTVSHGRELAHAYVNLLNSLVYSCAHHDFSVARVNICSCATRSCFFRPVVRNLGALLW